ncbi:hypothetical protein V6N12_006335 [Hibiscus sabdariffa]|uniref:Tyrosine decarboxylase n=1 Tax=Hibiscus sabdariffa TaxID=183260 RepID=A0ABR2EYI5_9ROSI
MGSLASFNELGNGYGDHVNPLDPEEFRRQGHMIIDFLADYYQNIEKYPVLSQVEPGYLAKRLPTTAPYVAEPVEAILQDVQQHIIPGITHWQSPNYFAYFPSSGSVAGFLGEMLSTGFNVDPSSLIKSLSTNPEYLRNKASDSKQVVDYKDWQITLSRRFRAMKLWLVLRSYGVANLRNFLRSHVKMAKRFEELVTNDARFEVVVPRYFAMVCFRVSPSALPFHDNDDDDETRANEFNRKLLETINAAGRIYATHAQVDGIYMIRFAIGASLTEDKHVTMAWKVVQETVDALLNNL